MNTPCKKTCLISFLAVAVFMFGYDFIVHGQLLKADYEATASMWRTPEEMQGLWPLCIAYHLGMAALFTCLFKKFRAGYAQCHAGAESACCPIKSGGLCFGIKIGLIMALIVGMNYTWLPIPASLAVKWFLASLIQGVGVGVILGMLCKGKGNCATTSCSTDAK